MVILEYSDRSCAGIDLTGWYKE
uniref:Uncharacterized protein n=1 Tax=Rhizophora mucronata TaxID=61149 RepID=A0A2P2NKJ0_RHIMU